MKIRQAVTLFILFLASWCGPVAADEQLDRKRMLEAIGKDVRDTAEFIDTEHLNEDVMRVLATVPRHEFVPENQRDHAYENRPLPIGYGQTISQPYIVALMTDLLRLQRGDRVLEIGTGSGYQAAVLAELGAEVHTVEIIAELGSAARQRLQRLDYSNVHTRSGDGYYGWEEHAPYDGIMVTAAASHVPPPLLDQLKAGGRMVIPIGDRFQVQHLMLVEKQTDGAITTRQILPVRFVPLTGGH